MKKNDGFVLVACLLFILLIAIMTVTSVHTTVGDLKIASGDRAAKQVFMLAESGVEEARNRISGLAGSPPWYIGRDLNTVKTYFPSATAFVTSLYNTNYVVEITYKTGNLLWNGSQEVSSGLGTNIYVINSIGFDANGASKRIRAEVARSLLANVGALYARENVRIQGASAAVIGTNPVACGGGTGVPAITTTFTSTGNSAPSSGSLTINTTAATIIGSPFNYGSAINIDVSAIINTLNTSSAVVHNFANALNYGDPGNLSDPACDKNRVIYVHSNTSSVFLRGGKGCGVLLVDGDWKLDGQTDGAFNWYGPIFIAGDMKFNGIGSNKVDVNIQGVIFSGGLVGSGLTDTDTLGGNATIHYCGSAISAVSSIPVGTNKILRWTEFPG